MSWRNTRQVNSLGGPRLYTKKYFSFFSTVHWLQKLCGSLMGWAAVWPSLWAGTHESQGLPDAWLGPNMCQAGCACGAHGYCARLTCIYTLLNFNTLPFCPHNCACGGLAWIFGIDSIKWFYCLLLFCCGAMRKVLCFSKLKRFTQFLVFCRHGMQGKGNVLREPKNSGSKHLKQMTRRLTCGW